MADANIPSRPMPADWSEAFAMLPPEPAPADAWSRLSAALPVATPTSRGASAMRSRYPQRRRLLAAVAAVAFALPVAWWLGSSSQAPTRRPAPEVAAVERAMDARAAPSTRGSSSAPAVASGTSHAGAEGLARDAFASPPSASKPTGRDAPHAVAERPHVAARPKTLASTGPEAPMPTGSAPRIAAVDPRPSAGPNAGEAAPIDPEAARIATLRSESARLEALVAYARDDRMASAPAAVLTAAVDDRIRLIDAALMQPELDAAVRSSLWTERVGALQELASLEGTQRWMAAHGASMDAVARVD